MKSKPIYLTLFFLFFIATVFVFAQKLTAIPNNLDSMERWSLKKDPISPLKTRTFHSFVCSGITYVNDQQVPFWLRSMRYGAIPQEGMSASLFAGAFKDYNLERNNKLLDWSAGFEIYGNAGKKLNTHFIQAYAKGRFGIFQLIIGRTKDMIGLVDSSLSTGAFAISGNASGIPKIEISNPESWAPLLTGQLIAFKGSFSHGWMGDAYSATSELMHRTFLHHKALYGRFGKSHWRIKLYGGFNHQAMWGSEKEMYAASGIDLGIDNWEAYKYVFIGKAYGTDLIPSSKIGNHLGSIDQALELNLKTIQLFAYHQFYYEAGALAKLANIKDGTWGLSIKNTVNNKTIFCWKKILAEFIHSTSQGGELDAPTRPSGWEDYYNNFQYTDGWIYEGENIGNPLFSSRKYIRSQLPQSKNIANNRLTALHLAFLGGYKKLMFITRLTFSKNYGIYNHYPAHRGRGTEIIRNPPPY
ncbi:MAG: capsule assembly Wzi family protein, partial [Bacteroidota bacterium]